MLLIIYDLILYQNIQFLKLLHNNKLKSINIIS